MEYDRAELKLFAALSYIANSELAHGQRVHASLATFGHLDETRDIPPDLRDEYHSMHRSVKLADKHPDAAREATTAMLTLYTKLVRTNLLASQATKKA